MRLFKRRLSVVAGTVVVIVVVGAVVALLLLRSHQAPPPLSLSTPTASSQGSALAGKWSVASGSQVGYRAREKFINQTSQTEAVARSTSVTGGLMASVSGSTVSVTQMKFTVDLAALTSQDKYANYQAYQRDFFVRTIYLQTNVYPTATFTASAASFTLPASGLVKLDITGNLSVHGVTKPVTAQIEAQTVGSGAEVAGSIAVDMRDFGIEVPDISFTRAEPQLLIEFDLKLVHS